MILMELSPNVRVLKVRMASIVWFTIVVLRARSVSSFQTRDSFQIAFRIQIKPTVSAGIFPGCHSLLTERGLSER